MNFSLIALEWDWDWDWEDDEAVKEGGVGGAGGVDGDDTGPDLALSGEDALAVVAYRLFQFARLFPTATFAPPTITAKYLPRSARIVGDMISDEAREQLNT